MNTIIIELCAEDRARLDAILDALKKAAPRCDSCVQLVNDLHTIKNATTNATGNEEVAPPQETQPEPEKPTAAEIENEAPATKADPTPESDEPAVTLEQIQQKGVQLAAGNGGEKKAAVREIINAYAKKVSDLPKDKWDEVWKKLTALEG